MVVASKGYLKRRNDIAYITTAPAAVTAPATTREFNPIRWLLRLDAAYREADKLKKSEAHRLQDMGLTRDQANSAFYGRFGEHRYYSR